MPDFPDFDLIDTPNPDESAVAITCRVAEINLAQMPVAGTTTYAQFGRGTNGTRVDEFGSYVFTGKTKPAVGAMTFLFGRNKAAAVANTPFRTTTWTGNHRWPPILLRVHIEPDYGSPRSFPVFSGTDIGTGFGPSYNDQVIYIPDVAEGTRFVKNEYFAPTPFDIPQYPVPVCTAVNYRMPGGETGSFPECLHDTIVIPAMITGQTAIIAGAATSIGTVIAEQVFPATNFISWAPYVLSDHQEYQSGGWYRTRIKVFPPPLPEAVTSIN